MATVCIHHHENDILAAEVLGGALLSRARVRLQLYPANAPGAPPGYGPRADRHLVLWTASAQWHAPLRAAVASLHASGAHYLLLRRRDAPVPAGTCLDQQWPIFEKGCDWVEYRGMLRKRLGLEAVDETVTWTEWPQRMLQPATLLSGGGLPWMLSGAAGAILLWALLA